MLPQGSEAFPVRTVAEQVCRVFNDDSPQVLQKSMSGIGS